MRHGLAALSNLLGLAKFRRSRTVKSDAETRFFLRLVAHNVFFLCGSNYGETVLDIYQQTVAWQALRRYDLPEISSNLAAA